MTPKEKAEDLVAMFHQYIPLAQDDYGTNNKIEYKIFNAKQCALIAVDEWLKMLDGLNKPEYVLFDIYEPHQYTMQGEEIFNGYTMQEYLQQVKEEINEIP